MKDGVTNATMPIEIDDLSLKDITPPEDGEEGSGEPSTPLPTPAATTYLTLDGVNLDAGAYSALTVTDVSNMVLTLVGNNSLVSSHHSGIEKPGQGGGKLSIGGSGTLYAEGGLAGIGGQYSLDLTIVGGTITAQGAGLAPGIGSIDSVFTASANVTIRGGTVTATGGAGGAGIGCAAGVAGALKIAVTIDGGTVTATGGNGAAGIGHGADFHGDAHAALTVTINGGTVTATGGANTGGGGAAGIGFGGCVVLTQSYMDITINGGMVTATGGKGTVNAPTQSAHRLGGTGIGHSGAPVPSLYEGTSRITINGGMIHATGGESSYLNNKGDSVGIPPTSLGCAAQWAQDLCPVIINGGSMKNKGGLSYFPLHNSAGKELAQQTLTLLQSLNAADYAKDMLLTSLKMTLPGATAEQTYALTDVRTDENGQLYVWLPEDAQVTEILNAQNERYPCLSASLNIFMKEVVATTLPITTEVTSGEGRLVVYRSPATPEGVYDHDNKLWLKPFADSLTEGLAGTEYKVVVDAPQGYALDTITLNGYPELIARTGYYRFGSAYGGDVYTFKMPSDSAARLPPRLRKTPPAKRALPPRPGLRGAATTARPGARWRTQATI